MFDRERAIEPMSVAPWTFCWESTVAREGAYAFATRLTPQRMQSIGIVFGKVESKPVNSELRFYGNLQVDEQRQWRTTSFSAYSF